jgi:hypothetical protein
MTSHTLDSDGAAASNRKALVSGGDRRTLDAIFRHPLAHNLSWREIVSLFTTIGAAEEKHNGEFIFRAADDALTMKRPHTKDVSGSDVMDLRHFLSRTGWSPDVKAQPEPVMAARQPGLVVVVEHAGAKVYSVDRSVGEAHSVSADTPQHFLHQPEGKTRDRDREETYPDDLRFFEEVALAMAAPGEIVVIGHGEGQSNEAHHLIAYLRARHKPTAARIVREIVADLSRLTAPELIELARPAFGND